MTTTRKETQDLTNTQHTPAPWHTFTREDGSDTFVLNHVGTVICTLSNNFNDSTEANAQLIASAPELLKENEQLKLEAMELRGEIEKGSKAFRVEAANFDKEWQRRKNAEALNNELLAALETVIEFDDGSNSIPLWILDIVKTAIAKAKG